MLTRPRSGAASVLLATLVLQSAAFAQPTPDAPAPPQPSQPASPPSAPTPDKKEEARARFERGVDLVKEKAWGPALAEFIASRELFATKNATTNAAICLRQLQRFDEALAMAEVLLRDFDATLTPAEKTEAQRMVVDLSAVVGTIAIEGAEPGALIAVDASKRGEFPLLAPLRVGAGSHVVRIYKEGYVPFEERVDVAGGQTVPVRARLGALGTSGRLEVREKTGAPFEIIVDGNVVGKTPWTGPLAVGDHTLLLRGEGFIGTQPVTVSVRANALTSLKLGAEPLEGALHIEPTPAGATLAIDGVTVGRGAWDGHLRTGEHTIELAAPGFLPSERKFRLESGKREALFVTLQRDPRSPFWRAPPPPAHWIVELDGGVPLASSLGGDVVDGCTGACARDIGAGVAIVLRGGYELGSGIGFGLGAGYVHLRQTTSSRPTVLVPVGASSPDAFDHGAADDTITVRRGALFGAWVGATFGDRFPGHLRLNAGILAASATDTRSGHFKTPTGDAYDLVPAATADGAAFFHLGPEVRVGAKLTKNVEINAGIEALVLFPFSTPVWDKTRLIGAGTDGVGTFPADRILASPVVAIEPGLGVRYQFSR